MERIFKYRFYILGLMFLANLIMFWPGYLQSDGIVQLAQAISGNYTDHHPPLMSFVWHYLNFIYEGPALMYTLQLLLLYSSISILMKTLDLLSNNKSNYLYLLLLGLPVYPQILIYSVLVIKDAHYTFSFLFCASVLSYVTIKNQGLPAKYLLLLLPILIYGSAVKYQGQFCAIVLALWMGALLFHKNKKSIKVLAGVSIYSLVFIAILTGNNFLVPQKNKNHAWQFVKLYDLAAISIQTQSDLIPHANKTQNYTIEKLYSRFEYPRVDPYIFSEDNILQIAPSDNDMKILYQTWLQNVLRHPYIYTKHRFINMGYALASRPGHQYVAPLIVKIEPKFLQPIIKNIIDVVLYLFMSHLLIILIGICYLIYALKNWHYSRVAPVLFGFSAVAVLMVSILFFMSMAGVPRYTYIAIVMINAAHIFAFYCYKDRQLMHKATL